MLVTICDDLSALDFLFLRCFFLLLFSAAFVSPIGELCFVTSERCFVGAMTTSLSSFVVVSVVAVWSYAEKRQAIGSING